MQIKHRENIWKSMIPNRIHSNLALTQTLSRTLELTYALKTKDENEQFCLTLIQNFQKMIFVSWIWKEGHELKEMRWGVINDKLFISIEFNKLIKSQNYWKDNIYKMWISTLFIIPVLVFTYFLYKYVLKPYRGMQFYKKQKIKGAVITPFAPILGAYAMIQKDFK